MSASSNPSHGVPRCGGQSTWEREEGLQGGSGAGCGEKVGEQSGGRSSHGSGSPALGQRSGSALHGLSVAPGAVVANLKLKDRPWWQKTLLQKAEDHLGWGEGLIGVVQRRTGTPRLGGERRPRTGGKSLGRSREASVGYFRLEVGAALVCHRACWARLPPCPEGSGPF